LISEHRYREELPNFSIWYVKPWFSLTFGQGFIRLPNKYSIEYRHKPRFKLLYLRFHHNGGQSPWQSVCMVRNRSNLKLVRMECPYCCACIEQIWAIHTEKGGWRCKFCIELPSGHRSTHHIKRFKEAIRSGNLQILVAGLQAGGMQTLDARLAMEHEGISPRKLLVESNSRQNQTKLSKYLERHTSRHRLRCRVGRGRLLYVEGRLYVR
jgi:hypothetical protein